MDDRSEEMVVCISVSAAPSRADVPRQTAASLGYCIERGLCPRFVPAHRKAVHLFRQGQYVCLQAGSQESQ